MPIQGKIQAQSPQTLKEVIDIIHLAETEDKPLAVSPNGKIKLASGLQRLVFRSDSQRSKEQEKVIDVFIKKALASPGRSDRAFPQYPNESTKDPITRLCKLLVLQQAKQSNRLTSAQLLTTVANATIGEGRSDWQSTPLGLATASGDFSFLNEALNAEPAEQIKILGQAYTQLEAFDLKLDILKKRSPPENQNDGPQDLNPENKGITQKQIAQETQRLYALRENLQRQIDLVLEALDSTSTPLKKFEEASKKEENSILKPILSKGIG